MSYSALGNVRIAPGSNGGTSLGVDTTGANLIWFFVTSYSAAGAPTVSDSKTNSWTSRTAYVSGNVRLQMFWCNPTSVGAGHTFTLTGTGSFSTGYIQYLSGAAASLPVDQEITGTSITTTVQAGSVTPTQDNELCVSGYIDAGAGTINETYTLLYQDDSSGSGFAGGVAYKIQTTAAATNPTWTVTNASSSEVRAYTITFKAGSAPAAAVAQAFMHLARQRR